MNTTFQKGGEMKELKIEKGIPIPVPRSFVKWKPIFENMEIGDSFFISEEGYKNSDTMITSINSSSRSVFPKKMAVRKVDGGARVWRIA
jgi:hypothetical protein